MQGSVRRHIIAHWRSGQEELSYLELKYDYDCERDDTNSLLGVLMFGWDVVIANNE